MIKESQKATKYKWKFYAIFPPVSYEKQIFLLPEAMDVATRFAV